MSGKLSKPDGSPFRVLIVDDSVFVQKQLTNILASEGMEVVDMASNGEEAVEKYKQYHPGIDLVTLDITMPGMDGVTCLERIMEFDKNARIMMVTALGKPDLVKKSFLLGAKNYFVKPLDRDKVIERIKKVFEES